MNLPRGRVLVWGVVIGHFPDRSDRVGGTGNANAAALETDINNVIAAYEAVFSDPVTVSIDYQVSHAGSGGYLGQNTSVVYATDYNTGYLPALIADAKTPNDGIALAHLPTIPSTYDALISSANGRAVGLNTPGVLAANGQLNTGGTFDGIIRINADQPFQYTRNANGTVNGGAYDAIRVIEHETDEVLGLGSILPSTTDFLGNLAIRPEDLYRYSSPGSPSLTASGSASAYLSVDGGTTNIVGLNQNSAGDYGDWLSIGCPALVQDAFSCSGQTANIGPTSPEITALDVIGYDLRIPEPSSLLLLGSSLLGGALLRRRRQGR